MNYYCLAPKSVKGVATAYTPNDVPYADELASSLRGLTEVPFVFNLKHARYVKTKWTISDDLSGVQQLWLDLQPNNLAWPMMSEKMKDLIEPRLTQKEGIVWMLTKVQAGGDIRRYFIPRFQHQLDVLNKEKTLFGDPDFVVKPVFSLEKIINYSVFPIPRDSWEIPTGLHINEEIKKALQKEKITGIGFLKAEVV